MHECDVSGSNENEMDAQQLQNDRAVSLKMQTMVVGLGKLK